jgi:dihydroorotate dehydrogenase electron transfer subunit
MQIIDMNFQPLLISAQIIENKEIVSGYFQMKINAPEIASRVIPGQFFHIKVTERHDLILRRPLSIFDYDDASISILYELAGKGTSILTQKKPGEEIDILGPLGNGYTLPMEAKKVILVAGGIGVAPLFPWAKELVNINKRGRKIDVEVIIGARNQYRILCEKNFKKIGLNPVIATDDGSAGYKGFVTDLLKEKLIATDDRLSTFVYACGPQIMLKTAASVLNAYNVKGEISMEKWMGCGVGVCLGCVVKTIDGKYKRACKDGPVFKADEVVWE